MPERERKKRDDLEKKEKKIPSPFDGEKEDEGLLDEIDDLVNERGEEEVEKRKDEDAE